MILHAMRYRLWVVSLRTPTGSFNMQSTSYGHPLKPAQHVDYLCCNFEHRSHIGSYIQAWAKARRRNASWDLMTSSKCSTNPSKCPLSKVRSSAFGACCANRRMGPAGTIVSPVASPTQSGEEMSLA